MMRLTVSIDVDRLRRIRHSSNASFTMVPMLVKISIASESTAIPVATRFRNAFHCPKPMMPPRLRIIIESIDDLEHMIESYLRCSDVVARMIVILIMRVLSICASLACYNTVFKGLFFE